MNKTVREQLRKSYQRLLDRGNFPEVGWHRGPVYEYDTNEYLRVWGHFAHLVDQALKQRGYNLGCYELRRSERFQNDAVRIIAAVTPQDIAECPHMFCVPEHY